MTTDPFIEAAREEARRYHWELREDGDLYYPPLKFGQHMAEWARTHLAAQEPTDAEVLVAREAVREVWRKQNRLDLGHVGLMEAYARAALSAARAARRDEEKR